MDQTEEQSLSKEARKFDHVSVDYRDRWPEIWRDLRSESPVFHAPQHGGFWVVSRYDDVAGVSRQSDTFASGRWTDEAGVLQGGISIPPLEFRIIPDESDKPEWVEYRGVLNANLGPQAIERRRERAQQIATALVDRHIETGKIDLVWDLTNPLPAIVTLDLLGLPITEWRAYSSPYHGVNAPQGSDLWRQANEELVVVAENLRMAARDRRKNPRDDLITAVALTRRGDDLLTEDEVTDLLVQTLGGGVDTTTALTSNTLMYLHQHPEARQRLIDEPEIRPKAREEFVRYFTPVMTTARTATEDTEIAGHKVHRGERVLAAYCSANRDPAVFDDPERVILDRTPNRHVGFGAGMHRCVGSNLARMMFDTMVGEVLARLPDYVVDEDAAERYISTPIVNGWMTMPATFTPGKKSGNEDILG